MSTASTAHGAPASTEPTTVALVGELVSLLDELAGHEIEVDVEPWATDSIRRLRLTSVRLLEFMVAVEDAFDIEWDDDLEPDVAREFAAMARHISTTRGPR